MTGQAIVKRYTNGEVTVLWTPDVCIHSTICFRGLPAVFDPRRRPWVDAKAASTAERKDGVTAFCRCGASGNKPFCDRSHARVGFQG